MKTYVLVLLLAVALLNARPCMAQQKIEKFEIVSQEVKDETYSIEVILPNDYDAEKEYPALYFTDWWWYTSNLVTSLMEILKYQMEPVIIVGIQSKNAINESDWNMIRARDLTPVNIPEMDSLLGIPRGTTGGSARFLSFIKNELIPSVEKKYATDKNNRGYAGYSFGGLFGTYILLNEPGLFTKYLIGSPSLWYGDYLLSGQLAEMKEDHLNSIHSIYCAVEESGSQLRGYSELREQILLKKPDALRTEFVIILDEDHMAAIPSTILKGLKFLFGK